MEQKQLLSKLIEISKNSDNDEIIRLIQYQLEIELGTLKQISSLQTLTINLLKKAANQTIELDEILNKIKTLEKIKKETDFEIQNLETLRSQIGTE
jgi:hypothetical protein